MPDVGKKRGRKPIFDATTGARAKELYRQGTPVSRILRELGISHATFYRHQREWKLPVLRVGVLDFLGLSTQRYNAFPHGNHPAYLDLQVMKLIAEQRQVRIQFKPVAFPALLEGVAQGDFDLGIGQICPSALRRRTFRFSEPYDQFGEGPNIALVAAKGSLISPENPLSLRGRAVASVKGSLCAEWLAEKHPLARAHLVGRPQTAHAALLQEQVDATVLSLPEQRFFVASAAAFEIKGPLICYESRKLCAVFNRDNAQLEDEISTLLLKLKREHRIEQLDEMLRLEQMMRS